MDVVRRKITDIRGTVEIDSRIDEGTTISIKLPLTLSIIDGLLVKINETFFIIQLPVVEKVYEVKTSDMLGKFNNQIQLDGELVPFVEGAGNYTPFWASFAPDGKWIAYSSDESGRNEVYIESFPDRGKRTRVSTRGGVFPRWRRDGRELFFVVEDDDNQWMRGRSALVEFHAVDIEQVDGVLRPGTPTLLFEARAYVWNQYYDVTADGERFIIGITPELPARPIHVVSDWRRELEE